MTHRARTACATTTARSPRWPRTRERQVGEPFFQLAAPGRQRLAARTSRPRSRATQRGARRSTTRPARLDVPGRHAGRPPLAADGARVPPRRARRDRPAGPHRAWERGRGVRARGRADRRPDADLPRLRRDLQRPHAPLITAALRENEITGQSIAPSRFLPGMQWLEPATVAEALGAPRAAAAAAQPRGARAGHCTAPGSTRTTVGDLRLNPNGANRIPVADDLDVHGALHQPGRERRDRRARRGEHHAAARRRSGPRARSSRFARGRARRPP